MIPALVALLALAGSLPGKAKPAASDEPSFIPPGAPRPKGFSWVRHEGEQERRRRMRRSLRRAAKLKDAASVAARQAIRAAVAMEPEPDDGELHLTHAAMCAADETKTTWAESVLYLLESFAKRAEESDAAAA